MKKTLNCDNMSYKTIDLSVNFCGITLKNSIILASGVLGASCNVLIEVKNS
jgi:dihydroorotate dehydrogenase